LNISLHKVWQVEESSISKEKIFELITYAKSKGFKVNFPHLEFSSSCYADAFNQAVINYDGKVYKCTARDFSKHTADGELLGNGMIIWNLEKKLNRHCKHIQTACRECKLFPACSGVCSQASIESKTTVCRFANSAFSKEDFVIYNFNKNHS